MSIKDDTDRQVQKSAAESLRAISHNLYRFSSADLNRKVAEETHNAPFDTTSPEAWENKIKSMYRTIFFIAAGTRDSMEAWREVTKAFSDVVTELYKAYDIMGRAVEAMCTMSGIDFDTFLERWQDSHGEKGEKPLSPKQPSDIVQSNQSQETGQVQQNEEKPKSRLPF